MRGLLAIALCLLLAPALAAQRRGGVAAGRSAGGAHAAFSTRNFSPGPHRGGVIIHPGFRGPFLGPGFRRSGFRRRVFFTTFPGWAYYGYGSFYDSDSVYQNDSYSSSAYALANAYDARDRELQDQVESLREEVARLTGAVESRNAAAVTALPAKPAANQPATPTVLVRQDGTREEVQNYAIVGQTAWVFSEQRARKVPLAGLDVDATVKANDARGVQFQVPR